MSYLTDKRTPRTQRKGRAVSATGEAANRRNWAQGFVVKAAIALLGSLKSKYRGDVKLYAAIDDAVAALERVGLSVDAAWQREKYTLNTKKLGAEIDEVRSEIQSEIQKNGKKMLGTTEDNWFNS